MIGRRRRTQATRDPNNHPGPAPTATRDHRTGWTACLPDPTSQAVWAEPFAEDLCRACARAFAAFAPDGPVVGRPLTLPISVPFDEHGVVVLSSAPPNPDAPRVPAELELVAGAGGDPTPFSLYGLALARVDRQPLLVPGLTRPGATEPVPLTLLTFAVGGKGMAIAGYDADGQLTALHLDETTARALAIALLITIGVKLTKAGYSG